VIYREMPAIWDPAFRRRFYERWGRESAVISAQCRRAEYPEYTQLLSIKTVSGGTEDYFVDGRRIAVEDDTYLVLNAGRMYGSRIESLRPVHSFSIFFEPGMAEDVRRNLEEPTESLLETQGTEANAQLMEFDEHVREHDTLVTPVLRHIRATIQTGLANEAWLDEQLRFLLGRMVRAERRQRRRRELIPGRPAVRRELQRRLGLAVTYIHTHYREPVGLSEMARAARLSPCHLLRTFKAYHGITPSAYLNQKRVNTARRLIATTRSTVTEIAEQVGFGNRSTLYRQMRARHGMSPAEA
jgi:AraC family transcriptional regulator